jgi:signal transduction histidine kinase
LNNLISNAVKFSQSASTVVIGLSLAGEDVVMVVEDRGTGIPRDVLDKIFSPFGTPTIRGPSGEKSTGLGLLIARRVAEAHRGRLQLESESGRGTRVEIIIPRTGMLE